MSVYIDTKKFNITSCPDCRYEEYVKREEGRDLAFECDDFMAPTIQLLNRKGYETAFCCQGHAPSYYWDTPNKNESGKLTVDGELLYNKMRKDPFLFEEPYLLFTGKGSENLNKMGIDPSCNLHIDEIWTTRIVYHEISKENRIRVGIDTCDIPNEIHNDYWLAMDWLLYVNRVLYNWAKRLPKVKEEKNGKN